MTVRDSADAVLPDSPVNILLVEDNIDQRELTITALHENMPNAHVTEAENGPSALECLRSGPFDVVILDYSLPGMNGLEVLREIKQINPNIPVIMVTGQGDETIAVDAMKNGAHDYIIKIKNYHEALPATIARTISQSRMKIELEEASLRGRRLYELSLAAASERKVDTLSECLVKGAAKLIGVEKSILCLINASGSVSFVKTHGIDTDENELMGPLERIGLLSGAYRENRPVVVEQPITHPQWAATPWLHPMLRQALTVPLTMQGKVEGVLCVLNKLNHQLFSPEDVDTLSTLAVHAGVAIDNARFIEKIEQQAVTDSLTGLYNHMEFQKCLTKEVERSRRYNKEFSLLLLDLDHFKMVNDNYGHQVGDLVLKEIAQTMHHCLRAVDKVFRYGGEEFAVILPEVKPDRVKIITERIRQAIADSSYQVGKDQAVSITVSIGFSSFPNDTLQRDEMIHRADQALYSAKRAGRNRVVAYSRDIENAGDNGPAMLEDYLCTPQMMVLRDLAAFIHAKTPDKKADTEGMVHHTLRLAEALKLQDNDKETLEFASLFHNIGVVDAPDKGTASPDRQTGKIRPTGAARPTPAQALIEQTQQLATVLQTIVYLRERYDGQGNPNGLKGEAIPYLARVLSVVDAYHEMTTVRLPKLSGRQAIQELKNNAGGQFDPAIVEAYTALLEQDSISMADLV